MQPTLIALLACEQIHLDPRGTWSMSGVGNLSVVDGAPSRIYLAVFVRYIGPSHPHELTVSVIERGTGCRRGEHVQPIPRQVDGAVCSVAAEVEITVAAAMDTTIRAEADGVLLGEVEHEIQVRLSDRETAPPPRPPIVGRSVEDLVREVLDEPALSPASGD